MKKTIIIVGLLFMVVGGYAQIITPIANIQDSLDVYIGQTVTIEGVITIGAGIINTGVLQAYIQDESEKGIMIFDYDLFNFYIDDIIRGNKLRVMGMVAEYNGKTEIIDFQYLILETGLNISNYTIGMSINQALNYSELEGTFASISGILSCPPYYVGGGYNLTIIDSTDQIVVRVWDSTGINVDNLDVGQLLDINGVIGVYNDQGQIIPGYSEDISLNVNIDEDFIFKSDKVLYLNNYPNPFNPITTIEFNLNESGFVQVEIFNVKGQLVNSLININKDTGYHSVVWDGSDQYGNQISSGLYLYKLKANGNVLSTNKCLLLK